MQPEELRVTAAHEAAHRKADVPTRFFNVLSDPIPPADYVVMLSSLYHFRWRAGDVLERMNAAARVAVVISELIQNLSAHPSWRGRIAGGLSNAGVGEYRERFDLTELRALADAHGAAEFRYFEGDRKAIVVFPPISARSRAAP
jgi:hypothetical protein